MKECPACHRCFPDQVNHCPSDGDRLKFLIQLDTLLDDRYQLEKKLGQGGMGLVFKAHHKFIKTQHAIKVILPDLVGNDPSLAARFRQEAMAAAAIRHPNTVSVTDYGVLDGTTPYLVMEFIEGRSLHEVLAEEKRLSPELAVEIMLAACAGVAAAHRQGIVHRDLKPLNIMLRPGVPPGECLKVLDFGLAKIKSGELLGSFVAAQTQGMMGSPFYMAPEQWSDDDIDVRADIYSLGVILYQMLAGDVPFKGKSVPSIMSMHLNTAPVALSERGIEVPPLLERAVRHALEKEPDKRPQTVDEFMAELREALPQLNGNAVLRDAGASTVPLGPADRTGLHGAQGLATGTHQESADSLKTIASTPDALDTGALEKEARSPGTSTVAESPGTPADEGVTGGRGSDTARHSPAQTIGQFVGDAAPSTQQFPSEALTEPLPRLPDDRAAQAERLRAEALRRRQEEERQRRKSEELERREAEEREKRDRQERTRREAEERRRLEAEERQRLEAEARQRREAEERARREAEERTQREAEERASREEEERRREAEDKRQREAEERQRREAEERSRLEAEERGQREVEERRRREDEESAAAALDAERDTAGAYAGDDDEESAYVGGAAGFSPSPGVAAPVGAAYGEGAYGEVAHDALTHGGVGHDAVMHGGVAQGGGVPVRSRTPLIVVGVVVVALVLLAGVGGVALLLLRKSETTNANAAANMNATANTNAGGVGNTNAGPTNGRGRADLVWIPGGTFQMGRSDVPPFTDELKTRRAGYLLWMYSQWPAHEVSVNSFAIDRTEVTNAEYADFVKETGHAPPPGGIWDGNRPKRGEERLPVSNVSFDDASAFAEWRSRRDGQTYRLPTEEEWEYAARGGDPSRMYPWGAEWSAGYANLAGDGVAPVGSYPSGRTPQGLEDMIGNLWEWTGSEASMYKGNDRTALAPEDRGKMVARGGSFKSRPDGDEPVTVSARRWLARGFRDPVLGFRLVRAEQP